MDGQDQIKMKALTSCISPPFLWGRKSFLCILPIFLHQFLRLLFIQLNKLHLIKQGACIWYCEIGCNRKICVSFVFFPDGQYGNQASHFQNVPDQSPYHCAYFYHKLEHRIILSAKFTLRYHYYFRLNNCCFWLLYPML